MLVLTLVVSALAALGPGLELVGELGDDELGADDVPLDGAG